MKVATRINSFLSKYDGDLMRVFDEFEKLGLTHVDLNYPEHTGDIPPETMKEELAKRHLEDNGLAVRFRGDFINGELGNKDPQVAQKALELAYAAADYTRAVGGRVLTVWLGYDGFDYPFQVDYMRMWMQIREAFQKICDYAPDLMISIEYKPFEERAYAFIDSLGLVVALLDEIDRPNIGATLDYCHMLMKHDNPGYGADLLGARGQLLGVHLNDGYGRFDDGLMVGTVTIPQTLEFLYYAKKHNYDYAIYFDTFPIIEDAVEECARNIAMLRRMEATIDAIGMDRIEAVIQENDAVRAADLILAAFSQQPLNFPEGA